MSNELGLAIILQIVGVAVIIAEVIIPSGGMLGILAAGIIGYSLYTVFSNFSVEMGLVFVFADLIIIPILVVIGLKMLVKSPLTLRMELSRKDGVTSQAPKMAEYAGKEGIAVSALRPSGVAVIEDERLDVVTRGEYIDKGMAVVVDEISGNRIIVKEKE